MKPNENTASAPEPLPENKTLTTGLPVRIKGLVWGGDMDGTYVLIKVMGIQYEVHFNGLREIVWMVFINGQSTPCESLEHGKRICQQDFEKRLREWIVTPDDGKESV